MSIKTNYILNQLMLENREMSSKELMDRTGIHSKTTFHRSISFLKARCLIYSRRERINGERGFIKDNVYVRLINNLEQIRFFIKKNEEYWDKRNRGERTIAYRKKPTNKSIVLKTLLLFDKEMNSKELIKETNITCHSSSFLRTLDFLFKMRAIKKRIVKYKYPHTKVALWSINEQALPRTLRYIEKYGK